MAFEVAKPARVGLEDCIREGGAKTGTISSLFPFGHSP